jgi:hypothetical protein
MMLGIRISDTRQQGVNSFLSFDLRDILATIGEPAIASRWRCRDLYYTARKGGKLDAHREARLKLSGGELARLASEIIQTFDGQFEARGEGAARRPWLIIRAVDGSWFEVWSSKPAVLERLKSRFKNVSELPPSEAHNVGSQV